MIEHFSMTSGAWHGPPNICILVILLCSTKVYFCRLNGVSWDGYSQRSTQPRFVVTFFIRSSIHTTCSSKRLKYTGGPKGGAEGLRFYCPSTFSSNSVQAP